jgi:hypothetical protein
MDVISYSKAAEQEDRIRVTHTNPDSTSGFVTQPRVIGAGETITIPADRQVLIGEISVEGTLNNEGLLISLGVPNG